MVQLYGRGAEQREEAERLVEIRDLRDEADRAKAFVLVAGDELGRRRGRPWVGEDDRPALGDRAPARRATAAPGPGHDRQEGGPEAAVRRKPEGVVTVLHGPESGLVRLEQRDGMVEDVIEDPVEVAVAAGRRGAVGRARPRIGRGQAPFACAFGCPFGGRVHPTRSPACRRRLFGRACRILARRPPSSSRGSGRPWHAATPGGAPAHPDRIGRAGRGR